MMQGDNIEWFALVVKPRHEKVVDAGLRTKGIESFLPVYSERRRWADRYTDVILPLFPGYVFSRFEARSRSFILSTPGIFDLVRCGKEPAAIPDDEIAALQAAMNCGRSLEPWPHLAPGELVEMDGGPLAGLIGKVLQVKNATKLVLSVSLLNRSVLIEIEREWVRPLASRKGQSAVLAGPAVLQRTS
jgi:transcription antitermination factor NusG